MKRKNVATFFAILAAALYAINIPISKLLLAHVGPTMMAAYLYLGGGIGMLIYSFISIAISKASNRKASNGKSSKGSSNIPLNISMFSAEKRLTKAELPYTIGMVVLDIAAPILLMIGISNTTSANVSLLNNFEIVATSIIALLIFKEVISKRLWFAISLVTIASVILSFEGQGAFVFNKGSAFVLGACICWGFENNCTKMLSNKSSQEIVIIKGIFSGLGSLIIALCLDEGFPAFKWIISAMLLGFVAYGMSINFYIMAQKELGAAKTSAYYSIAPFLGVAFSLIILGERPGIQFYIALVIMLISTYFMVKDSIVLQHTHEHSHTHCHEHRHGDLVHTHEHTHVHTHLHIHSNEALESHNHSLSDLADSHNHSHE